MTDQQAQEFADAVNRLERDGDVDAFVSDRFAPDAVLVRPEAGGAAGSTPAEFWQRYLAPFAEITSTFDRVTRSGDIGVLEWTSTGRLSGGRAISYSGVSILDFDGDRVARFATYYDTQPFGTVLPT